MINKKEIEKILTIDAFLSNHSTNRNLDNVFKKWLFSMDSSNPQKTIEEWSSLFQKFLNE